LAAKSDIAITFVETFTYLVVLRGAMALPVNGSRLALFE
jgi:hypothetical protein